MSKYIRANQMMYKSVIIAIGVICVYTSKHLSIVPVLICYLLITLYLAYAIMAKSYVFSTNAGKIITLLLCVDRFLNGQNMNLLEYTLLIILLLFITIWSIVSIKEIKG